MEDNLAYLHGQALLCNRVPYDQVRRTCLASFVPLLPEAAVVEAMDRLREELERTYVYKHPSASIDQRLRDNSFWWYTGPEDPSPCWDAYRAYLALSSRADIGQVDRASTRILSLCEAPGGGPFASRGLVIGYVQSGKTTNFAAVMAKAADAGYNFFVVLSGVTNSLRDQTQARLWDSLHESMPGVSKWHWLTTNESDFSTTVNASQLLSTPGTCNIAVIKKNAARLKKLVTWVKSASPQVRSDVRMLIIDDEADQATLNTSKGLKARTAVNQGLMSLLDTSTMPKAAYIGYSATPFANLLIDPDEGGSAAPGLYPRDFIVSLDKGDGYFGPEELFGREALDEDDEDGVEGADIIRWIPDTDRASLGTAVDPSSAQAPILTETLTSAIDWFVIATAVRRLRERKSRFSTMLVHVSARVKSHEAMAHLLKQHLDSWRENGPRYRDKILSDLWNRECDRASELTGERTPEWHEISELITDVVETLRVVTDNSQSMDRLDYSETDAPVPVIVVGGNTLARGLTLEGLVSTYFMRTSTMYDSLLQMGRWFGYRPGYEDLQRIWMTEDLAGWFRDLALVEEEVRQSIKVYEEDEVTPLEMQAQIRLLPGLRVTSAAKMQSAVTGRIGFSSKRVETILFPVNDGGWLKHNLDAGQRLTRGLREADYSPRRTRTGPWLYQDVAWSHVRTFLEDYRVSPRSRAVDTELIIEYVERVQARNELKEWNVFLYDHSRRKASAPTYDFADEFEVSKISRSRIRTSDMSQANIHHLVSKSDAVVDVPAQFDADIAQLRKLNSGLEAWTALRAKSGLGDKGLIGLYVIDKDSSAAGKLGREDLGAVEDVLGVGIFFPKSKDRLSAVDYVSAPGSKFLEPEIDLDLDLDAQFDELNEGDDES